MAREAWIESAGRMLQHQAAWDLDVTDLLGRKPQIFNDDAYALTWRAASESLNELDRTMGRPLQREVPGRGLSR